MRYTFIVLNCIRSQCFPLQVTGWPLELIAYAYLAVSPPSMSGKFEEMASAASNKKASNKELKYPELEEQALQFILDSCESSISKYTKFLQVIITATISFFYTNIWVYSDCVISLTGQTS
ncbi:putative rubisco LSMT, substrate-binding domain-containing protein [Helianthus annuus]|nr:putative rubisco LSMT, substrate-binding domain-containing protein [Helianthus annuus]KAJ0684254.1 putative rubisco LSMT, substrate-binding domain-containing protein [Helianthus annuus]KAJ0688207.1 putative rubisco LSMT, substrate-binding domain-containing protein [Helianthus annuus]